MAEQTEHSDALAEELRKVVSEAEALLGAMGDEGDGALQSLRDRVHDSIDTAKARLADLQEQADRIGQRAATAAANWIVENPWTAVAIGASIGLIIGMMVRTARGHTGRILRADRADTACFVLVLLAALARILVPLVAPSQALAAVLGSAAFWTLGFGLYAVHYWPVLTRARLDGKPG